MYPLTLTKAERSAIDWIGDRYTHGSDLHDVLSMCKYSPCEETEGMPDNMWADYDGDITFEFTLEHLAWEAKALINLDDLACFAPELVNKLNNWAANIV